VRGVVLALPNPVEVIGEGLGTAASKAAESAFEFFMTRLATALANAASKVVDEVLAYLATSSTVSLDQGWWAGPRARDIGQAVVVFAGALLVLFLLVAIVQGLIRGDVGLMVRTVAVEAPVSVFAMAAITTVTGVLLAATDGVSSWVLAGAPENIAGFFAFGEPQSILSLGLFGFILIPGFILAAIVVWIELAVRSALLYLLLAFSPLVLAVRVWPALSGAWHQLCRIGLALIASKFVISLALGLGAAALAGGGPGNLGAPGPNANDMGTQVGLTVGGLVMGLSLMVLAAFAPFVVLKFFPVFEAALVAQGISRGPIRAAQTGAQGAYYAQGLRRLAGTDSGGGTAAPGDGAAGSLDGDDAGSPTGGGRGPGPGAGISGPRGGGRPPSRGDSAAPGGGGAGSIGVGGAGAGEPAGTSAGGNGRLPAAAPGPAVPVGLAAKTSADALRQRARAGAASTENGARP
jgi:uncharacterized integral membrane protein